MNKLALSSLACPKWEIAKIIDAVVKYGYDAIDFRGYLGDVEVINSDAFKGRRLKELASMIKDAGKEVSCLSSSVVMVCPSREDRAESVDVLKRYIDCCYALDCKTVRIFGGGIGTITDPVANAAEGLGIFSDLSKESGVIFGIETHDDWTSAVYLKEAFDAAGWPEGVGIVWDLSNPYRFHGESPEVAYAALGRALINTHWRDSVIEADGKCRNVLTGEGTMPFAEIYKLLMDGGYEGYFTFEWLKRWHSEMEEPEIAVPHFIEFMKRLRGQ